MVYIYILSVVFSSKCSLFHNSNVFGSCIIHILYTLYDKNKKIIPAPKAAVRQPGHYSSLTAPNLQPTVNQERNDQCGNQHHSRELLMMGIVMPETC
jgi:hypothetical protein